MKNRVGFIGLGSMGLPMAKRIAAQAFDLSVFDVNPEPVQALLAAFPAVRAEENCCEMGKNCSVVITMLPNAAAVEAVCVGSVGLFAGMRTGTIWIDMTTGDPFTTRRLAALAAEAGIRCLDCPCGRSPEHAQRGELLGLVGGERETLEEVSPLLRTMTSDLIYCGGSGMGHTMKLINNLLSGVIQEANLEALSLGMRAGIPVSTMLEVFHKVCVWNGYLSGLPQEEASAPGWKVTTAEEHMELVQKLGAEYQVPIYTPAVVRGRMQEMIAKGKGDIQYSSLKALMKHMAEIEIKEEIIAPEPSELG